MKNRYRILRNTVGMLIKLTIVPGILYLFPDLFPTSAPDIFSKLLGALLFLIGFLGMLHSDLLLLRFGDGNLHFEPMKTRLVSVGFYARTRHPAFWFFMLHFIGCHLFFLGFHLMVPVATLAVLFLYLLWIILIEERILSRALGQKYLQYQQDTPLFYWKLKIPENLRVGFRPQLIWVLGMSLIRHWYGIKSEGLEHIPHEKPFLIVANHESYIDPFLFGLFIPYEIKFVTTADVFTTPLMRFLLKGTGSFPMRRHRQDLKSIRTMIRMINKGQVVCIFPEGGRSTYGAPLPILKETLKLIQKCRVPILPIHIDGAYEIWPRWAPNRRRGKVNTTIKPIIPVESQSDLGHLEDLITNAIFDQENKLRTVKSRAITRGMSKMLWACCKCQKQNSIKETSGDSITCQNCGTRWLVQNNYDFKEEGSSSTLNSIEWIETIESVMLDSPISGKLPFEKSPDEVVFLQTPLLNYSREDELIAESNLSLFISNQRIILVENDAIKNDWLLENITIFTMDYFNAVSIGFGGIRHSFKLPEDEISLKWQTYFDTLKANLITSGDNSV